MATPERQFRISIPVRCAELDGNGEPINTYQYTLRFEGEADSEGGFVRKVGDMLQFLLESHT